MEFRSIEKQEILDRMDEFCALHKACFSAPMDEKIILHRYYENPYGDASIIFAEDNGKLVASVASQPMQVYCDGKVYDANTRLNGMVLPEYSGRGLFQSVMSAMCQKHTQSGRPFCYAFPHYTTNKALSANLGWTNVYEVPTMQATLPENNNFASLDTAGVKKVCADDIKWEPTAKICVYKTTEYLKWRYENNPINKYEIVKAEDGSWMIYKPYKDELNLVELHHKSGEGLKQLLYYAYKLSAQSGYTKISTWAHINTEKHHLLEKFGFRLAAPIRFFATKKFSDEVEFDIHDWRNWELSMGDHNAY